MPLTPPRTKDELLAITRELPDTAFFQEHSREREINYIERSFTRWSEIIDIARSHMSADLGGLSCLDVGTSPFTFRLKSVFKDVCALDLSDSFQERASAYGIELRKGGVHSPEALATLDKVDCVFCLEVLEHLHSNPVDVIAGLRSLLKPGGILILSTPNMMCFANRVLMLTNGRLHHFASPPFAISDAAHGFAHDRIYMPAELKNFFASAGFSEAHTLYQLHVNDMAHHGHSAFKRFLEIGPAVIKRVIPSVRDGVIMVGRKT